MTTDQEVLDTLKIINENIRRLNDNLGSWTKWEKEQILDASEVNSNMKTLSTRVYYLTAAIFVLTVVMVIIQLV